MRSILTCLGGLLIVAMAGCGSEPPPPPPAKAMGPVVKPKEEPTVVPVESVRVVVLQYRPQKLPVYDDLVAFEQNLAAVEAWLDPAHDRIAIDWKKLREGTAGFTNAINRAVEKHLETAMVKPKGGGPLAFGNECHRDMVNLLKLSRRIQWAVEAKHLVHARENFKYLNVLLGERKLDKELRQAMKMEKEYQAAKQRREAKADASVQDVLADLESKNKQPTTSKDGASNTDKAANVEGTPGDAANPDGTVKDNTAGEKETVIKEDPKTAETADPKPSQPDATPATPASGETVKADPPKPAPKPAYPSEADEEKLYEGKDDRWGDLKQLMINTNVRSRHRFWPVPVGYLATDRTLVPAAPRIQSTMDLNYRRAQWGKPESINERILELENKVRKQRKAGVGGGN